MTVPMADTTIPMTELEKVQKLFHQAWPRREPPALDRCYSMAVCIDVVKTIAQRKTTQNPKRKDDLVKSGEKFLQDLAEKKKVLQDQIASFGPNAAVASKLGGFDISLQKMIEAEQAVAGLLDEFKPIKANPARFLEEAAQETWRQIGEDVPTSKNRDDPLCVFTTNALAACGIYYSQSHVSDMLRRRA